jgi:hypothetical protein
VHVAGDELLVGHVLEHGEREHEVGARGLDRRQAVAVPEHEAHAGQVDELTGAPDHRRLMSTPTTCSNPRPASARQIRPSPLPISTARPVPGGEAGAPSSASATMRSPERQKACMSGAS